MALGEFEQVVLTSILSVKAHAYGVTIHGKVEELSAPRKVTLGAVYVTLDRLEEKGMVSSWLSDPTPERGGRAKRCYKLDPSGEVALQESMRAAQRMLNALPKRWRKAWN